METMSSQITAPACTVTKSRRIKKAGEGIVRIFAKSLGDISHDNISKFKTNPIQSSKLDDSNINADAGDIADITTTKLLEGNPDQLQDNLTVEFESNTVCSTYSKYEKANVTDSESKVVLDSHDPNNDVNNMNKIGCFKEHEISLEVEDSKTSETDHLQPHVDVELDGIGISKDKSRGYKADAIERDSDYRQQNHTRDQRNNASCRENRNSCSCKDQRDNMSFRAHANNVSFKEHKNNVSCRDQRNHFSGKEPKNMSSREFRNNTRIRGFTDSNSVREHRHTGFRELTDSNSGREYRYTGQNRYGQKQFIRDNSSYSNKNVINNFGLDKIPPRFRHGSQFKTIHPPPRTNENWMTDLLDTSELCERNCQELCEGNNKGSDQIHTEDENNSKEKDGNSCYCPLTVADEVAASGCEDWSSDLALNEIALLTRSIEQPGSRDVQQSYSIHKGFDMKTTTDDVDDCILKIDHDVDISEANNDQVVPSNNLVASFSELHEDVSFHNSNVKDCEQTEKQDFEVDKDDQSKIVLESTNKSRICESEKHTNQNISDQSEYANLTDPFHSEITDLEQLNTNFETVGDSWRKKEESHFNEADEEIMKEKVSNTVVKRMTSAGGNVTDENTEEFMENVFCEKSENCFDIKNMENEVLDLNLINCLETDKMNATEQNFGVKVKEDINNNCFDGLNITLQIDDQEKIPVCQVDEGILEDFPQARGASAIFRKLEICDKKYDLDFERINDNCSINRLVDDCGNMIEKCKKSCAEGLQAENHVQHSVTDSDIGLQEDNSIKDGNLYCNDTASEVNSLAPGSVVVNGNNTFNSHLDDSAVIENKQEEYIAERVQTENPVQHSVTDSDIGLQEDGSIKNVSLCWNDTAHEINSLAPGSDVVNVNNTCNSRVDDCPVMENKEGGYTAEEVKTENHVQHSVTDNDIGLQEDGSIKDVSLYGNDSADEIKCCASGYDVVNGDSTCNSHVYDGAIIENKEEEYTAEGVQTENHTKHSVTESDIGLQEIGSIKDVSLCGNDTADEIKSLALGYDVVNGDSTCDSHVYDGAIIENKEKEHTAEEVQTENDTQHSVTDTDIGLQEIGSVKDVNLCGNDTADEIKSLAEGNHVINNDSTCNSHVDDAPVMETIKKVCTFNEVKECDSTQQYATVGSINMQASNCYNDVKVHKNVSVDEVKSCISTEFFGINNVANVNNPSHLENCVKGSHVGKDGTSGHGQQIVDSSVDEIMSCMSAKGLKKNDDDDGIRNHGKDHGFMSSCEMGDQLQQIVNRNDTVSEIKSSTSTKSNETAVSHSDRNRSKKKRRSNEKEKKPLCEISSLLLSVGMGGNVQNYQSDTSSTTDSQIVDNGSIGNTTYEKLIRGKQKALKKERCSKSFIKKSDKRAELKKNDTEETKAEKRTIAPSLFIDLMNVLQISGVSKSQTQSYNFDNNQLTSNCIRPIYQSSPKLQINTRQFLNMGENWEQELFPVKISVSTPDSTEGSVSVTSSYFENNDTVNTTGSEMFFSCEEGLNSDCFDSENNKNNAFYGKDKKKIESFDNPDQLKKSDVSELKTVMIPESKEKFVQRGFSFNNSWEEKLTTLCAERKLIKHKRDRMNSSKQSRQCSDIGPSESQGNKCEKSNDVPDSKNDLMGCPTAGSFSAPNLTTVRQISSSKRMKETCLPNQKVQNEAMKMSAFQNTSSDIYGKVLWTNNKSYEPVDNITSNRQEDWENSLIDVEKYVSEYLDDRTKLSAEGSESVSSCGDGDNESCESDGSHDIEVNRIMNTEELVNVESEVSSEVEKRDVFCYSPISENTLSEVLTISDYENSCVGDEVVVIDSLSEKEKDKTSSEEELNISVGNQDFVHNSVNFENNSETSVDERKSGPFYPWPGYIYGYRENSNGLSDSLEVIAPQSEEKSRNTKVFSSAPSYNTNPNACTPLCDHQHRELKLEQTLNVDQMHKQNLFESCPNISKSIDNIDSNHVEDANQCHGIGCTCVCPATDVLFWTWRSCSCHFGQRPFLCDIRSASNWLLQPLMPSFMYYSQAKGCMLNREPDKNMMNTDSAYESDNLIPKRKDYTFNDRTQKSGATSLNNSSNNPKNDITPPPKQQMSPNIAQRPQIQPWMFSPPPPPPPPPSMELWNRMQNWTRFPPPPSPRQLHSPSVLPHVNKQWPESPSFVSSSPVRNRGTTPSPGLPNYPPTSNHDSCISSSRLPNYPTKSKKDNATPSERFPNYSPVQQFPHGTPPPQLARMSSPYNYPRIPEAFYHSSNLIAAPPGEKHRVSPVTESFNAASLSPADHIETGLNEKNEKLSASDGVDSIKALNAVLNSDSVYDKVIKRELLQKLNYLTPKLVDYGLSETDDSDEGKKMLNNNESLDVKLETTEENVVHQGKRRKLDGHISEANFAKEKLNDIKEDESRSQFNVRRISDSQIFGKEEFLQTLKDENKMVPELYIPPFRRKFVAESDSDSSSSVHQKKNMLSQGRAVVNKGRGRRLSYSRKEESTDPDEEDSSDISFSVASQEDGADGSNQGIKVNSQPSTPSNNNVSFPFWASYSSPDISPLYGYQQPYLYPPYPLYPCNYFSQSYSGFDLEPPKDKTEQPKSFNRAISDSELHKNISSYKENLLKTVKSESLTPPIPPRLRFLKGIQQTDTDSESTSSVSQTDWKLRFKNRCKSYGVKFIDSHCHIDFLLYRQSFQGSWNKYLLVNEDTVPDNYEGCIAVFCSPSSFRPDDGQWKEIAKEENVWLAMGCHPKSATEFTPRAEEGLRRCLQHKKMVALGEIGLDYSGMFKQHEEVQKTVFKKQIQIALDCNKPLVIHCRDAEDECLEILETMVPKNYKIHCHCFTGNYNSAKRWMDLFPNLYIGLTPVVTFRTALPSHEVARFIPLERLLLETDAPYFVPRMVPKNEMKYSHPGLAITVAEAVAWRKKCTVSEVLTACRQNTRNMYGV